MAIVYTDAEIEELIKRPKHLSIEDQIFNKLKKRHGHEEKEILLDEQDSICFKIIIRRSTSMPLNFSVILAVIPERSNKPFRLRRYNSLARHTNRIEGNTLLGFHIHIASERYQEKGWKEDAYAVQSHDFSDIRGAIQLMIEECNITLEEDGLSLGI